MAMLLSSIRPVARQGTCRGSGQSRSSPRLAPLGARRPGIAGARYVRTKVARPSAEADGVSPIVNVSKELLSSLDDKGNTGSHADLPAWKNLVKEVDAVNKMHLRDLLRDEKRCESMIKSVAGEEGKVFLDYSRQRVTKDTMSKLFKLADETDLRGKIDAMWNGDRINTTEDRAVLHVALRAQRGQTIMTDGKNVVPDVWEVLDKIKNFSDKVRNGEWVGVTGKPLTTVVAIGIGGSFLGPLFVHTALRTDQSAADVSSGRSLRFLANVDPIDVARALNGLDAETTLVVVVSKTFTTAETMLNARTVRKWLITELEDENAVAKHMVAVSTNIKLVKEFGIDPNNAFGFWNWVGGRYSVCSAVGMLPLSLQYGFETMERFLKGAHDMDEHFRTAQFEDNLPVLTGLLSVWNTTFLGYPARAILPYCQALSKLAPHIQQVSMESNGKGVAIDGTRLPYDCGEIDFGEPGTNGQHSFYQLIHQGRTIPCDFIGIVKSQQSVYLKGEIVSNHDELMCNFFAQADALAIGKDMVTLRSENVPDSLIPHKYFTGNRPSMSFLLPQLDAYSVGQLLSLYENRVAVQGFLWGINSFDQWGVELGKVLASKIRSKMNECRTNGRQLDASGDGFNYSTTRMLNCYLEGKASLKYAEPMDVFPCDLIDSELCRPPTSYM
mmetsp:Transcript_20351/g.56403  ORF Transcript_20351/g.56403 Transcript_20351/m.56403 type:complete len:668 (+) Transcript_20351:173-2176(+)|eukprot:CAMPEP_0117668754 /NCGR_PEP_ID=MMETSP0804-20121206/11735_1 /TAXON_ID=1074897 /ORGANISM="Tetraselmis astigmatica, Strain CCMP880" /LENGTH=667 /DNA_ID=CAMNT_0005476701 /DNA_START=117 /DNA_END=2120 /DNA_ORIENTATION=+